MVKHTLTVAPSYSHYSAADKWANISPLWTNLGHVLVKTKYLILCSAPSKAVALNDSGILLEYCPDH